MTTDADKRNFKFFEFDLEQRGVMFRHALVRSQLGSRNAIEFIEFIKLVWADEMQGLKDIPCDASPDRGMLKALGYRVGEEGVEVSERRLILDYLLTEDALPAIDCLGYVRQWGKASEPTRREKLRWVISNLIHEKWGMVEYGKAVKDWKADLAYVAKAAGMAIPISRVAGRAEKGT